MILKTQWPYRAKLQVWSERLRRWKTVYCRYELLSRNLVQLHMAGLQARFSVRQGKDEWLWLSKDSILTTTPPTNR